MKVVIILVMLTLGMLEILDPVILGKVVEVCDYFLYIGKLGCDNFRNSDTSCEIL